MTKTVWKVDASTFAQAISELVGQELGDLADTVEDVVAETSDDLARDVSARASSLFGGTGEYAAGWTDTVNRNGYSTVGVVYNGGADHSLAHLLEYGHELFVNAGSPPGNHAVHAGRVEGRRHIEPAFDQAVSDMDGRLRREV